MDLKHLGLGLGTDVSAQHRCLLDACCCRWHFEQGHIALPPPTPSSHSSVFVATQARQCCPSCVVCLPVAMQGATHAIIVEGEMDKLAIEAATGHTAVVSLPAGAVPSSSSPFKPHSKKLECVDRAAQQLSQLQECLIAVDGDGPGWATAQALANRVRPFLRPGAALHYLAWPSAGVGGQETLQRVAQAAKARGVSEEAVAAAAHCKDANDVLMTCGPEFLRTYLQHGAVPFPNM